MKNDAQDPVDTEVSRRRASSTRLASRRLAGVGSEILASIIGLGLLGYAADRWIWHSTTPSWCTVIGLILGVVGGMYNAIKKARAFFADENGNESENDEPGPPAAGH